MSSACLAATGVGPNGRRSIRVFRIRHCISRFRPIHRRAETAASGHANRKHANARPDLLGAPDLGDRVARLGHFRPDALAHRDRRAPARHHRPEGRCHGLQPRLRPRHADRSRLFRHRVVLRRPARDTRSRHIRHSAYCRCRGGRGRDLDLHARRLRAIGQRNAPVRDRARHRARDGPCAGRFGPPPPRGRAQWRDPRLRLDRRRLCPRADSAGQSRDLCRRHRAYPHHRPRGPTLRDRGGPG
jgi:hypothetical protein